jgi:hypothetical protein
MVDGWSSVWLEHRWVRRYGDRSPPQLPGPGAPGHCEVKEGDEQWRDSVKFVL